MIFHRRLSQPNARDASSSLPARAYRWDRHRICPRLRHSPTWLPREWFAFSNFQLPCLPSVASLNHEAIVNDVLTIAGGVLQHATELDFVETSVLHAFNTWALSSSSQVHHSGQFVFCNVASECGLIGGRIYALTLYAIIHMLSHVSPKYRFNVMIEPERIALLREIERRTGATPSEQIRRAIEAYIRSQTVLTKKEVAKILKEREE